MNNIYKQKKISHPSHASVSNNEAIGLKQLLQLFDHQKCFSSEKLWEMNNIPNHEKSW